jgi:hypothetical protein
MINITYMISILNFIFTVVFYVTKWTKHDHICICFEEILNQLNLLYIYICLYLQSILIFVFSNVFYEIKKQDLNYIYLKKIKST